MADGATSRVLTAIRKHGRSYDPSQSTISFGELCAVDELCDLIDGLCGVVEEAEAADLVDVVRPAERRPRRLRNGLDDGTLLTIHHDPWRTQRIGPDASGAWLDVDILVDEGRSDGGTCGSSLWASSLAAIDFLCEPGRGRLEALVAGRSVLELGAGLGFVGKSLSLLGAQSVVCTDMPEQLALLQKNLERGCPPPRASARGELRSCGFVWGTRPEEVFSRHWDLVVGCDVCYDTKCVPHLAASLAELLVRAKAGASKVLLVAPSRVDFRYGRDGVGSGGRDSEPAVRPDYEYLLDTLASAVRSHTPPSADDAGPRRELHVERAASIPSGSFPRGSWPLGETPPSVDVLLLTLSRDS